MRPRHPQDVRGIRLVSSLTEEQRARVEASRPPLRAGLGAIDAPRVAVGCAHAVEDLEPIDPVVLATDPEEPDELRRAQLERGAWCRKCSSPPVQMHGPFHAESDASALAVAPAMCPRTSVDAPTTPTDGKR